MRARCATVLAVLCLLAARGWAQQEGEAAVGAPIAAPSAAEMIASTLPADIATATYYELVAWCRGLGLDESGGRVDLQQRLAAHFGVTLPPAPAAAARTVTIRSAREAEYRTDDASGETTVVLRGEVAISVYDAGRDTTQLIEASTIVYNQTRRTMSALGGVTYTLSRGARADVFSGESLAFDLDSGEAVFYDGTTTQSAARAGGPEGSFRGRTMTRLSNDTVILDQGSYTTSATPDDPLYHVSAARAWLLAPGEWAAADALLVVGRVPLAWLPGIFLPSDEFFFNPNVGYRDREGSFLQTTTYLLGRKPATDTPLSVLQLGTASGDGYALERRGLFLRRTSTSGKPADAGTLKLMLDAYSRLGLFAGLAGEFNPRGAFRVGLGLSRTIFLDSAVTGMYTPFLPMAVPGYELGQSVWNQSSVFGTIVPFRYGLDGTLKVSGDGASLSAAFQYFSDPVFTTDFYNRSEAGILASILPSSTATPQAVARQGTLAWDVSSKLDFSKAVGSAFASTVSIPTLGARVAWQSASLPPPLDLVEQYDPRSSFYYPTSVTAPTASVLVSGELFSWPPKTAPGQAAGAGKGSGAQEAAMGTSTVSGPGKGLRFTLPGRDEAGAAPPAPARIPFRAPSPLGNAATTARGDGLATVRVAYQVQPQATLEHAFDTSGWTAPADIDYALKYRTLAASGSSSVTATASFWDRAADLTLGAAAEGLWKERFDPSAAEAALPEWDSLRLRDLQQDRFTLRSNLQAIVRPFLGLPELAGSTLQYRLGVRWYQLAWDPLSGVDNPAFTAPALDWSRDTLADHSAAGTLALALGGTTESLALSVQLPPLTTAATGTLSVAVGGLKGRLQAGVSAPETGVVYQPLVAGLAADFGGRVTASQDVQVDVATATVQRAVSAVQLGPFSGAFTAQWMQPLTGAGTPVPGAPEALQPYSVKLGLETGSQPSWYWKDRVRVDLGVQSHLSLNLQKHTDNLFDFSTSLKVSVYKALDLTFASTSTNSKVYRYIPGWAAELGEASMNPLLDLAHSFAFLDPEARKRSAFKIRTIGVTAVQHFPDWELSCQYQGSPQLRVDPSDGKQRFLWTPTFSIQVQWGVSTILGSTLKGDENGLTLR